MKNIHVKITKNGIVTIDGDNQNIYKLWELSKYLYDIQCVYLDNILDYLTNFEADRTLRDILKILKTDGILKIKVSDLDYYASLWLDSHWDEETLKDESSNAKISFKAIYGPQTDSDPWTKTYNEKYTFVKKSGYNKKRIKLLLQRIGYTILNIDVNDGFIKIKAKKEVNNSERQTSTTIENIRLDHRRRYDFANNFIIKSNSIIADAACGVGYGSLILSQNKNVAKIYSLDISSEALEHAKKYFINNKSDYKKINLAEDNFYFEKLDYFVSFETIEHITKFEEVIVKIHSVLKNDGVFIGSVPNETIMPFNPMSFMYHVRHFTNKEIVEILERNNFKKIRLFGQNRDNPSEIIENIEGDYTIFIAYK